ncbi:zinc-dependent peptidase [Dokdonella sp. MW10]|uniref:M90 family metallopeptidase n=1 Tax=Dokdonella sp. MW10 TaxID=2992926 RepID=UPI003F7EACB2
MRWLARLRAALPGAAKPVAPIDAPRWRWLLASSELFTALDDADRATLRELCARFLARKSFSAAGGHALTDAQCLAIAALACLPVLRLGFDSLEGWSDVIVYPGGFRVRREYHDEHTGVVTEGDDELIGEAWEQGPVILSWSDVEEDLDHPFEGLNVVVHEIAHKLDMLDGAMNGVPRLPDSIPRREWITTMQAAFDAFRDEVDQGADTEIDPYAAESPEEFFAVLCEAWISSPAVVERSVPAVARLLDRFIGSPRRSA